MRPFFTASNGFAKSMTSTFFRGSILALILGATFASGCVYRVNIQQGNFLEGKTVDQLQVGMTRAQVRYLLGTPRMPNEFARERWAECDYFKKCRRCTP